MNSIKFWTLDDFEVSSYKYGIDSRKNKTFKTSGTDTTGFCTYTYNELGYRGDSIHKKGFKIMSIGCSNTEGVGLNYNDTWPSQFSKYIPDSVNLNFGTGGRSNDFISRCLLSYYDLIQPDLVLIMYTSNQRREFYSSRGGIEPFMATAAWGYLGEIEEGIRIQKNLEELQNDNEDFVNWYKNHLLIKYFLELKKCNWLWNGFWDIPKEYDEINRFDGKYGNLEDKAFDGTHPGPNHNALYSYKLVKHIKENFPNFIPTEVNLDNPNSYFKKLF